MHLMLNRRLVSLQIGYYQGSLLRKRSSPKNGMLLSCSFEVFGKVQKVYFRKFTQEQGQHLGLVGWVMNTQKGTVIGQMQGEEHKVKEMQEWLRNVGSPQSRIDKVEFSDVNQIDGLGYSVFEIRR
eukprot:TRINITY_DN3058_c0_g1_i5.p1 TRINITY_DN3058_c0_g1~~TRINITY_DN3058_c0_g1_i5.p1  ORF type:complete len:126 (-),score=4.58 TRINITY_DN3058_c0_g1_i5:100-477(-)